MESLTASTMIDCFRSHAVHCKSCMGAYEAFQCIAIFSNAIANACFSGLICIVFLAGTGNTAAYHIGIVKVMSAFIALIYFSSELLHRLCLKITKEFTANVTASRMFLSP